MKKKSVKEKVQEAMEKYKAATAKPQKEQPRTSRPLPKTGGAHTLRPEKKRG
jgi:hypothetical protein